MGKVYFPSKEWDEEEKDPVKAFKKWVKRNREAIQLALDLEIMEKAAREKCPMYDTVEYCHLYPDEKLCPTAGKLINWGCSLYKINLEEIMEIFKKNVQEYSRKFL